MYKRQLRIWGVRKNRRRTEATTAGTSGGGTSATARYLPQNDADESLHILLDLLAPWITQACLPWKSPTPTNNAKCRPRDVYIYDEFTQGIATAAEAFGSQDTIRGGEALRQAFIAMERTLEPSARSPFTLYSIFFALAILNQAGMFKAARILVTQATSLVILRTGTGGRHGVVALGQQQPDVHLDQGFEDVDKNGHQSHPFPQILKRLHIVTSSIDDDGAAMTEACTRAWQAYHRVVNGARDRSIALQICRREYWNTTISKQACLKRLPTASLAVEACGREVNTADLVLRNLTGFWGHAKSKWTADAEVSMMCLDEMVLVYAFCKYEKFEETALELLSRAEKQQSKFTAGDATQLEQWRRSANLELAFYYKEKGDQEKAAHHLDKVIPDTVGTQWESISRDRLRTWITGDNGKTAPMS